MLRYFDKYKGYNNSNIKLLLATPAYKVTAAGYACVRSHCCLLRLRAKSLLLVTPAHTLTAAGYACAQSRC